MKLQTLTLNGTTYDSFPDKDAVKTDQLQNAIDDALAQAKESGEFKGDRGADGEPGKSAYEYAQDGGYTGTEEEFATKIAKEIPDALPNPHPLTINGKSYNGSEAVDIQITGGTTSDNILLGQTPLTLLSDANVRLVGSGDYTYSVKGKTFADLTNMQVQSYGATLTEKENYIEIVTPDSTNWYDKYIVLKFDGLTVGESYIFVVVGMGLDTSNRISNGYYQIRSGTNTDLGRISDDAASVNSVQFTATTTNIEVRCYAAKDYYYNIGYRTARVGDIYLNNASEGTDRTSIIDDSGTFTNTYALGQLSKGVTITSTPSCEVYSVNSGGSSSSDVSTSLTGKTVVCFGDSIFGMYTGDTSAPAYAAKKTGATVHNVGFSGCRMSVHPYTGYNEFCMYALADAIASGDWSAQDANASNGSSNCPEQLAILKGIDFAEVDAIVIHYGTNDFTGGSGVPLDNESNPKDCNTLCGALRYSVEKLLSAYPKMKVFVSLPAFRYWTADDGTVTYSDTYKNGIGKVLPDYVKALAETANEYNLPVIDCYYGLGVNKINASTFLADGVHHNVEGRKLLGEYIGAKLIADGDTFYGTGSSNGGSASIDVTAEVGQTIVVEEVDANGKPTKWKAADYQPRTHWTDETVVLPETTVECVEMDGVMLGGLPEFAPFKYGETYEVMYNGTKYTLDGFDSYTDDQRLTGVGNIAALGFIGGDANAPFIVATQSEYDGEEWVTQWVVMSLDGSVNVTLSITKVNVTPIPIQYVGNAFPYYVKVYQTTGSTAGSESDYSCSETVSNLEAIYKSGRHIALLLELTDVDNEIVYNNYYQLMLVMSVSTSPRLMFAFSRAILDNPTEALIATPQEDGTYTISDRL